MEDNFTDWKIFLALWNRKSIQLAALDLQLPTSEVSRRIGKLEKRIGYKLFNRSTRPFVPTETAKDIVGRVQAMLTQHEMMFRYFQEKQEISNIIIRIMMGNSFRLFGTRKLTEYSQIVPGQRINVISPVDVDEFMIGKADLLDATGPISGNDLIMIPRGLVLYIPVASPEYVQQHGEIMRPGDIANHPVFSNHFKNRYSFRNPHVLKKGGQLSTFNYIESVRYSNVEMSLQATIDGAGIALSMPHYLCIDELEKGTLVPILNGWHRPAIENYLVSKKDTWKLKPIRTFATWFAKEQAEYLMDTERRLVRLYGKRFVENLKN